MKNNLQIAAICPRVSVADTKTNAKNIIKSTKLAAKKGVIHKKAAARKKSRLTRLVNKAAK